MRRRSRAELYPTTGGNAREQRKRGMHLCACPIAHHHPGVLIPIPVSLDNADGPGRPQLPCLLLLQLQGVGHGAGRRQIAVDADTVGARRKVLRDPLVLVLPRRIVMNAVPVQRRAVRTQ